MIDINAIRHPDILMHGLDKVNEIYTIYYDDTNNIIRLRVTPDGFNVCDPRCFVLGGAAHTGSERPLDIAGLRSLLGVQKSAHEVKLKHLGKGDFSQLLASSKIRSFLRWMIDADLFIQFQALDPIYWSIVDIVDSAIMAIGSVEFLAAAPILKSDLNAVLRIDLNGLADLFSRHSYPAVTGDQAIGFLRELVDIVRSRREVLPAFNFRMLEGLLLMAARNSRLPFHEGETPHVLIDEFSAFYIKRICLFKNSTHVLDSDDTIARRLEAERFVDGRRSVKNFRFASSRDVPGIQISDVIAGLLGKFFTFVGRTAHQQLDAIRSQFAGIQAENLALLGALIQRSIDENPAFASYVISEQDKSRSFSLLGC